MVTGVGDGGHFKQHKGMGLVKHVFQDELPHLMGNIGIGWCWVDQQCRLDSTIIFFVCCAVL